MRRLIRAWSGLRLPGLALLLAAVGLGALLGAKLGAGSWPVYVGVTAAALVVLALLDRRLARRRNVPSSRPRSRQKAVQGSQAAYDLSKDTSTDGQRYLM